MAEVKRRLEFINDIWLDEASYKETGTYNVITNRWEVVVGWHYHLLRSFQTKEEAEQFISDFRSFSPRRINGWMIEKNKFDWTPTKAYIVFHPMHDGFYWEQFDTSAEAVAFCTLERYIEWEDNLL